MRNAVRFVLIYLSFALAVSVISFYLIMYFVGSGSTKVGDALLAMFVSPYIGFISSIPLSILIYRFVNRKFK